VIDPGEPLGGNGLRVVTNPFPRRRRRPRVAVQDRVARRARREPPVFNALTGRDQSATSRVQDLRDPVTPDGAGRGSTPFRSAAGTIRRGSACRDEAGAGTYIPRAFRESAGGWP